MQWQTWEESRSLKYHVGLYLIGYATSHKGKLPVMASFASFWFLFRPTETPLGKIKTSEKGITFLHMALAQAG